MKTDPVTQAVTDLAQAIFGPVVRIIIGLSLLACLAGFIAGYGAGRGSRTDEVRTLIMRVGDRDVALNELAAERDRAAKIAEEWRAEHAKANDTIFRLLDERDAARAQVAATIFPEPNTPEVCE